LEGLPMKFLRDSLPMMASWTVAALLFSGLTPCFAQPTDPPATLLGLQDGQLLTRDDSLHVQINADMDVSAVEFWFYPDEDLPATRLGVDRQPFERAYGPDCDGPCFTANQFSLPLRYTVCGSRETTGAVEVRDMETGLTLATATVYWDPTPPLARILTPQFNQAQAHPGDGFRVIASSSDEDLVLVRVTFTPILVPGGGRGIPRFEQHFLGNLLSNGGHASCVPTAVGANLQWLQDTGQWITNPTFCGVGNDACLVTILGVHMGTTSSGTTGNGALDGLKEMLSTEFGYQQGTHYEMEQLLVPLEAAGFGFIGHRPDKIMEEFVAGSTINVGIHNIPGDPSFGHYLAVENIVLNADDSATLVLMDPNIEPPGSSQGVYRVFTLHPDGTMDWDVNVTGYYDPPSGKVRLDELLLLRGFSAPQPLAGGGQGGEVPGELNENGTWTGYFQPPSDQSGPWLLTTEAFDAAGNMQRDYQFIGGSDGCDR
jgi:hypothetical protein